jgi:hypothetical protein
MSDASSGRIERLNPIAKFALWMLVADILVAGIMLVILKEPIPVLVTFAIIYSWSFAFLRRQIFTGSGSDARA